MVLPIVGIQVGDWVNYAVGGACLLSVFAMLGFKSRLNRSDEDDTPRAHVHHEGLNEDSRMNSEETFLTTGATEQDV